MLMLLFNIGRDLYAIPTDQVVEVLPLIDCKRIPQSARGVAGLIDYHGAVVPLVDLTELTISKPSARVMSTRIILVRYADNSPESRLIGLIAERVTETLTAEERDFAVSGAGCAPAPYLGPVLKTPRGLIQRIDVNNLFTAEMQTQLFEHRSGSRA